jgi:Ni,Fe-hydrogenase I cytochrome b subunit
MLELIRALGGLINTSIAIVIALGLLAFFWGLAKFIFKVGGDEKAVDDGKRIMKWGLIALFVMVSVWGIIRFIDEAILSSSGGVSSPFDSLPPGE